MLMEMEKAKSTPVEHARLTEFELYVLRCYFWGNFQDLEWGMALAHACDKLLNLGYLKFGEGPPHVTPKGMRAIDMPGLAAMWEKAEKAGD